MLFKNYFRNIVLAFGLAALFGADHRASVRPTKEKTAIEGVIINKQAQTAEDLSRSAEQGATKFENVCNFPFYFPTGESSDRLFSHICSLDDFNLELIKGSITRRFVEEISAVIPGSLSEKGGDIYLSFDGMHFYEAPNLNDLESRQMKRLVICLEDGIETGVTDLTCMNGESVLTKIFDLEQRLKRHFSTGQCDAEQSDYGWKRIIKDIRETLNFARGLESPVYLRDAVKKYIEALNDTYNQGQIYEKQPIGIKSGNLHTHDNWSDFSGIDECLSDRSNEFYYLASYVYSYANTFKLYVMCRKKQELVGIYPIVNQCSDN